MKRTLTMANQEEPSDSKMKKRTSPSPMGNPSIASPDAMRSHHSSPKSQMLHSSQSGNKPHVELGDKKTSLKVCSNLSSKSDHSHLDSQNLVDRQQVSQDDLDSELKGLKIEITALKWLARRKEQEWEQVIRLLKLKEERHLRVERMKTTCILTERRDGPALTVPHAVLVNGQARASIPLPAPVNIVPPPAKAFQNCNTVRQVQTAMPATQKPHPVVPPKAPSNYIVMKCSPPARPFRPPLMRLKGYPRLYTQEEIQAMTPKTRANTPQIAPQPRITSVHSQAPLASYQQLNPNSSTIQAPMYGPPSPIPTAQKTVATLHAFETDLASEGMSSSGPPSPTPTAQNTPLPPFKADQASKEMGSSNDCPSKIPTTKKTITPLPPFEADLSSEERGSKLCQGCEMKAAEFVCVGCSQRWYCSRDCQVTDWKNHGEYCG